MVKSEDGVIINIYQNQMDRPKTQMDSRTVRASSSRTPRCSIDGLSTIVAGAPILSRPKSVVTRSSYSTKTQKAVEEVIELPDCRPTTSARRRQLYSPPSSQSESRPKTAPFPAKTWTQLVRDSSFHSQESVQGKQSIMVPPKNAWEDYSEVNDEGEYRIVLLGKEGSGKSSTGNCILGQDIFGKRSSKCRYGTSDRFGKKICVVDTYAVFDRNSDKSIIPSELVKLVGMTSPGFHVVILVLSIGNISNKEHRVYREFLRHFGDDIKRRTIILFTRRDILDNDGSTIYGYVSDVPKGIKDVMEQCRRRYIAFNNNAVGRERDVQVRRLLDMIDNIIKQNNGRHYSSEVYGATELIVRRRMDDIKRTFKEKMKLEEDHLEAKRKASESLRCSRSSLSIGDSHTQRTKSTKTKTKIKSSRKKKTKPELIESNEHFQKLPNLVFDNCDIKGKEKHKTKRKADDVPRTPRSASSKHDIAIEEDDDFGDCDIEALKRRIEEDFDIPILHLPNEDFIDYNDKWQNNNHLMNDCLNIDGKIKELKEKYEDEMSKHRLREKIRRECEDEQQEMFQMMWKLTRYFDESINFNEC